VPFTNVSKNATTYENVGSTEPPAAFGVARFGESQFGEGSVAETTDFTNVSKNSTSFTNTTKNP
jgi:hypothetical protein